MGLLTSDKRLLWTGLVLAAAILAFDMFVELGVAAGVPYLMLPLLCLASPKVENTWIALIGGTALILYGWAMSPDGGELWKVTLNRLLAFGALWATGLAVVNKQLVDQALLQAERARDEAQGKLRDKQELARIGQMATMIAHEVRNPLAGIKGAVTVIGRRFPEDAREQDVIRSINARIGSVNDSLQALLVYSRPPQPRRKPTSARSLVEATVAQLRADPELAGLDIVVDAQALHLDVDPQLIQQALMNLLLNCAHATERQGRIVVRARLDRPMCRLEVVDDGPGIDEELRSTIFDPFVTTRARGTGLGLATVKRTVETHGGTVEVRCPPEGGTIVSMSLPVAGTVASMPPSANERSVGEAREA